MKKLIFGAWLFVYTALALAGINAPTYNGQPYFRATINANQSLTTNVQTVVQWNVVSYDSGGYFNSGNWQYNPKVAGKYRVTAILGYVRSDNTASSGYFNTFIEKNGSVVSANAIGQFSAVMTGADIIVTDTVTMNGSTDYIRITGQCQFASGTCAIQNGTNNALSYWTVEYIGP
jgi:hypothetical protein